MTAAASSRAVWRKTSHSGANGDCVEVACPASGLVAVRDSKDPGGPRLAFTPGQWTAFTTALRETHQKHGLSPGRGPAGAAQEDIGRSLASTRRKSSSLTPALFMWVFHQSSHMQQSMKHEQACTARASRAVS
jgi:hypothetical protein